MIRCRKTVNKKKNLHGVLIRRVGNTVLDKKSTRSLCIMQQQFANRTHSVLLDNMPGTSCKNIHKMLMEKGGLRLHSYKLQNKFGLLHVPII